MATSRPKNDMSAARAALALKRQVTKFENNPPANTERSPQPPNHPPPNTELEYSSDNWSEEEEQMVPPAEVVPLGKKRRHLSYEIVPVKESPRPTKQRKTNHKEKVNTKEQDKEEDDIEPTVIQILGRNMADIVPKLFMLGAAFIVSVAIQTLPSAYQNPPQTSFSLPGHHPTATNQVVDVSNPNPPRDPNVVPSFIQMR